MEDAGRKSFTASIWKPRPSFHVMERGCIKPVESKSELTLTYIFSGFAGFVNAIILIFSRGIPDKPLLCGQYMRGHENPP